jgi:RNA polymerase sigma-70 factor (ECF subfamily)
MADEALEEPSDESLLERSVADGTVAQARDAAAGTLVSRHTPGALRFARRLLGRTHAAEDAVQEAWMRAFAAGISPAEGHPTPGPRPGFRGEASFRSYFFVILRRVCYSKLDRDPGRREVPLAPAPGKGGEPCSTILQGDRPGRTASPLEAAVASEEAATLEKALAGLPPADRSMVHLVYVEGFRVKEAARVLGLGYAAARARLHRALVKLKDAITSGI